jgi:hypothetical protein
VGEGFLKIWEETFSTIRHESFRWVLWDGFPQPPSRFTAERLQIPGRKQFWFAAINDDLPDIHPRFISSSHT